MRLIDADVAIRALENGRYSTDYCKEHGIDYSISMEMVRILLANLPSVQPERKKGIWTDDASCPFCKFQPWYEGDIHTLSFCPNCGADMRGDKQGRRIRMTVDEAINELIQCYSLNSKTAKKKNEAISMAIEALEKQQKQQWILATEKLPEVGQRVLVTTKDGFIDIRKCIDAGHLAWFYSGIIAWMPFLLKPYQGGEQE